MLSYIFNWCCCKHEYCSYTSPKCKFGTFLTRFPTNVDAILAWKLLLGYTYDEKLPKDARVSLEHFYDGDIKSYGASKFTVSKTEITFLSKSTDRKVNFQH